MLKVRTYTTGLLKYENGRQKTDNFREQLAPFYIDLKKDFVYTNVYTNEIQ